MKAIICNKCEGKIADELSLEEGESLEDRVHPLELPVIGDENEGLVVLIEGHLCEKCAVDLANWLGNGYPF